MLQKKNELLSLAYFFSSYFFLPKVLGVIPKWPYIFEAFIERNIPIAFLAKKYPISKVSTKRTKLRPTSWTPRRDGLKTFVNGLLTIKDDVCFDFGRCFFIHQK